MLEVLQLSVQHEGEADMDVELMRKGLLAVKLKGDGEAKRAGVARRGEDTVEREEDLMPGAAGATCLQIVGGIRWDGKDLILVICIARVHYNIILYQ